LVSSGKKGFISLFYKTKPALYSRRCERFETFLRDFFVINRLYITH
jgi:hypothetical protein